MLRNIESHNPSATVSQDDHNVEQSKRGRHGNEHVDGGDADLLRCAGSYAMSAKASQLVA
jgi:hypothetical protein